jgi:Meiotically up-regulated gene 113
VSRDQILAEIRRTAEANGGVPLGKARFAAATGVRENDWRGRFWARWGDALVEAGYQPNEFQQRRDEGEVLAKLVDEIRRLGRMPTVSELDLRRRADSTFPSAGVFERFGPKADWPGRVAEYCRDRSDDADVLAIVAPLIRAPEPELEEGAEAAGPSRDGFVYLLRSGRHYKIGYTLDVGRRRYDLAIQLPEAVEEEHRIRTDDPVGIERYWHERFAARRMNGEWFALTRGDIGAFKKRKFM